MRTIYVTGHINPDLDCTAAAYAYAYFKNRIDLKNRYIPIRCGALNEQTKTAFQKANVIPPRLYKKLVPLVGDVTRCDYISLQCDDPVLEALHLMYTKNLSFIPILKKNIFQGGLSINELALYLGQQSDRDRPIYHFKMDNIQKVLPGHFIHKGDCLEFDASVWAGAMPFNNYLKWNASFSKKPMLVTGNRERILNHAVSAQFPAIIITGVESENDIQVDFSSFRGSVYLSENDSAESLRLLRMSIPVNTIINKEIPQIQASTSFEEAKGMLMKSDLRGLPVFHGEDFLGIVTRRRFIEKPIKEIILVDHNEIHQSVPGAREARVLEIIDHHRFGAEKTSNPIYIAVKPVGSTCTIVFEHYINAHVEISQEIAIILQAGIISDTVNLKSPTTTSADIAALKHLSEISGVNSDEYVMEMFKQLKALRERDPEEIIGSDFKTYEQRGVHIGIGQVEVINLQEAQKMTSVFVKSLNKVAKNKFLDWTMLLITDVIKQHSILVSSDFILGMQFLIYQGIGKNTFDLPAILSRKKQLLPEVFRVSEEINSV